MNEKTMEVNEVALPVTTFNNDEFGSIRTMTIDGEPWFVGKDVTSILGYTNPSKAILDHVDADDKLNNETLSSLGQRGGWLINESGLYSLILSSKLPTAKRFKKWVTSEVLPSIRKHGAYLTEQKMDELIADPDMIIKLATQLKESRKRNKALIAENSYQKQVIADFEPVKQYVDTILESKGTLATTQIAADYGMSAVQLNRILKEEGIQWNVNGQWILRKPHMGKGYTDSKTISFCHSDGRPDTKVRTVWTQKGRLMIHEVLTKRGIKALMDR